jgi:hypothetical protein
MEHGTANYTDCDTLSTEDEDLTMEAVGYATGNHSPQNYCNMKARVISWCLDRKWFVRIQSRSTAVNDKDPGLLSSLFPHLDCWGIGGFCEPYHTPDQHISFECQVWNLLLQHNSPFQKDPNFVYICWNIIQKREVNKNVCFQTNEEMQDRFARELTDPAPHLTDLISKWEHDPNAKALNTDEKCALRLLSQLRVVAKDVKGSSGYKLCRRNEIRALMKIMSTPALFLMINPSDTTNPLLGVLGMSSCHHIYNCYMINCSSPMTSKKPSTMHLAKLLWRILSHLKRELIHAIWELLLDEKFMHAYKHGIVVECADHILHQLYPCLFTYLADYQK